MKPVYIIHEGHLPLDIQYGYNRNQSYPPKNYLGDVLISPWLTRATDFTDQVVYNRGGEFHLLDGDSTLEKAKVFFNPPRYLALDNKRVFWEEFPKMYQVYTFCSKELVEQNSKDGLIVPFPLIAKPEKGAESLYIKIFQNLQEFKEWDRTKYIYQPLLPIEKEYKLFFMDNRPAFLLERNRQSFIMGRGFVQEENKEVPLNTIEKIDFTEIEEYLDSKGKFIFSMDILQTPEEGFFILEINFTFGYRYDNIIGKTFWGYFNELIRKKYCD